jgi:CheY-like chemotaxis protein
VEDIPPLPRYAKVRLPATLLLVEDEDLVRITTAEGLRAEGFDVVEASSAAEALILIAGGLQPHLVITDHMMPNMTGAQLAAELRSFAPSLPVLMITGYASMTPGQTDGLEVLAKPFGLTDLVARVAWLLEHAPLATSIWPDAHVVP